MQLFLNIYSCFNVMIFISDIVFSKKVLIDFDQMNMTEIISAFGYPIEIHEVLTDDGYTLKNFRIPYGRKSIHKQPNKYPVLIHHGLMSSAECFLFGIPEKTPAYFLADRGFDVWLMNDRGTIHSRKHNEYDPDKDKRFWRYTFHEIAIFDVANTIDQILNVTQKQKLFYIGHSQGGTTGLLLLSEKPEYNAKIMFMEAMAPGVLFEHIRQPLVEIAVPHHAMLQDLAESLNSYEMLPKFIISNDQFRKLAQMLCGQNGFLTRETCISIMSLGSYENQIDPASVPFAVGAPLGGASVYQVIHFLQMIHTKKVLKMDWGPEENFNRYSSSEPPEYNLTKVTSPVGLMYGLGDTLVTAKDVIGLSKLLPNVVDLYGLPHENWTHTDYFWAKNLKPHLLDHLVELLYRFIP